MKFTKLPIYFIIGSLMACTSGPATEEKAAEETPKEEVVMKTSVVTLEAESNVGSSTNYMVVDGARSFVEMKEVGWLAYEVEFEVAGRYQVQVFASSADGGVVWLEDYIDNKDGRTYNVTGNIVVDPNTEYKEFSVDGSPFDAGTHMMKFQLSEGNVRIDKVVFNLLREHKASPVTLTQSMEGDEWSLVWSDEFDGETLDESKWTYDIGNWGWGNNELQYYTERRAENTRLEDGNLIIEARKNDMGQKWTSARLTTRGKQDFLYGKIEFKARVPKEKGNWAAGWTLGDDYVDEIDWPYCGEIDIMESVGYEIDDVSGDGIAHSTVHTPAYYFKINNQISSTTEVKNMNEAWHTYAVEWTPTEVRGYVDDQQYYVYDKNANDLEWPFAKPQNIILNLAMGGGWGGAQGMNETVQSQQLVIDYVRVYELK